MADTKLIAVLKVKAKILNWGGRDIAFILTDGGSWHSVDEYDGDYKIKLQELRWPRAKHCWYACYDIVAITGYTAQEALNGLHARIQVTHDRTRAVLLFGK